MEIRLLNWRLRLERVFHDEQTLAGMYDGVAGRWSRSIHRMGYLAAYDALFARLCAGATLAGVPAGASVLDAGIGTGELAAALARHRPDLTLHGLDISPAMLSVAQAKLGSQAELRQGNLLSLPYDDSTFDLVMSAHALEHLPDPAPGFAELMRVLKPGGVFVVVATRLCPITTVLSLRWNFRPMPTPTVRHALLDGGAQQVQVASLMPQPDMAYMSLVYSGTKRG